MKPHEEFVEEVIEKTKPLSVPEESEECMKESYEYDINKKGPRSRPEYERRKNDSTIIRSSNMEVAPAAVTSHATSSGGDAVYELDEKVADTAVKGVGKIMCDALKEEKLEIQNESNRRSMNKNGY